MHEKSLAETSHDCHLSTFYRSVPFFVVKPAASDWGTCLCRTCLNPELKLEKAIKLGILTRISGNLEKVLSEEEGAGNLIEAIENIVHEKDVSFSEWQMVPKEDGTSSKQTKSKMKLSRKVSVVLTLVQFKKRFIEQIQYLHAHLLRVQCQYRAFKKSEI